MNAAFDEDRETPDFSLSTSVFDSMLTRILEMVQRYSSNLSMSQEAKEVIDV